MGRRSGAAGTCLRAATDARASSRQIINGLTTGCLYALIALGYTMVYGVLKLLNFAHGDVYMIGAYIGYFVIQWFGGPDALSIPVPLLVALHVRSSPGWAAACWASRSSASPTGRYATRRASPR